MIVGTLRTGLTKVLGFHKIEWAQNLAGTKLSGPFAIKVAVAAMRMAEKADGQEEGVRAALNSVDKRWISR